MVQLTSRSSRSMTLAGSDRSLVGTEARQGGTKVFPEHLYDLARRLAEIEDATRRIEQANAALAETVAGLKPFQASRMGVKARARSAPSTRLAPLGAGKGEGLSSQLAFRDLNRKWGSPGARSAGARDDEELEALVAGTGGGGQGSPGLQLLPPPPNLPSHPVRAKQQQGLLQVTSPRSRSPSASPSPSPSPSASPSPLRHAGLDLTHPLQADRQQPSSLKPLGDPMKYSPLVRSFFSIVDVETAKPKFVKPPTVLERVRSAAFSKDTDGSTLRKVAAKTVARVREALGPAEVAVAESLARGHEVRLDKARALWRGAIVRKRMAILRSGVRRAVKMWRARKFRAQLEAKVRKLRVSEADAQAMRERAQEKLKTSPRLLAKVQLAVDQRRPPKWFSNPDRKARADRLAAELTEAGKFHIEERRQRAEAALGARNLPPVRPATEAAEVAPGSSDSVLGFVPLDFLKNLKRALQPIRSSEERINLLRAQAGLSRARSPAAKKALL